MPFIHHVIGCVYVMYVLLCCLHDTSWNSIGIIRRNLVVYSCVMHLQLFPVFNTKQQENNNKKIECGSSTYFLIKRPRSPLHIQNFVRWWSTHTERERESLNCISRAHFTCLYDTNMGGPRCTISLSSTHTQTQYRIINKFVANWMNANCKF